MNTSALKSFAPAVRRQLIEAVSRKLDYVLTADTPDLRAAAAEVKFLRQEAERDRNALIERVAYTWFNRLAALRFLDARGWHPFKARVLTAGTRDETQPELLKLLRSGSLPAELLPHTDLKRLNDLLDGRLPTATAGADPQGEAYRDLILAVCRFYHVLLPNLFEKLNDETELLLPDDLLTATSVAEGFRTAISDEDCSDVEILGWLYQFY
ncbi:MAG: class I SAM-dependent DNA methyltransferase, partial [Blastocatellia bacterium]|nr:class I SAM-dependent DNA methyltransferase [Blastocatellia bacterium]